MNLRFAVAFALVTSSLLAQPPGGSSDLEALVAAERAFAKMSVDKGIRDAFLTYFADDGINFDPAPVKTKENLLAKPAPTGPPTLVVEWEPRYADVAKAGDLGYTTGPAVLRDPAGKNPPRHGTYFTIWKKQSDGTWKVVLDAGSDGPGGPAPEIPPLRLAQPSWNGKPPAGSVVSLIDEDRTLQKASANGVVNAYLEMMSDEPRLHRWGRRPVSGRNAAQAFLSESTAAMQWEPLFSDVSRSQDLGYTYGRYALTHAKSQQDERGYYVHVWKRDAEGRWKIVLDTLSPVPQGDSETAYVNAGYKLLGDGKLSEAIELFKQMAARYPQSANALDCLSDAYDAAGNRALARELAQKAIDALPNDPNPDQAFKQRIRESAQSKLEKLK